MNRLVLIGNGFDLAHGLKTRYEDFLNWYWWQKLRIAATKHDEEYNDLLCKMTILTEDSRNTVPGTVLLEKSNVPMIARQNANFRKQLILNKV